MVVMVKVASLREMGNCTGIGFIGSWGLAWEGARRGIWGGWGNRGNSCWRRRSRKRRKKRRKKIRIEILKKREKIRKPHTQVPKNNSVWVPQNPSPANHQKSKKTKTSPQNPKNNNNNLCHHLNQNLKLNLKSLHKIHKPNTTKPVNLRKMIHQF